MFVVRGVTVRAWRRGHASRLLGFGCRAVTDMYGVLPLGLQRCTLSWD